MPFPEDDGSFVMPGTATRISVDKKSHHRLGVVDHKVYQAYYSDCIDSLMLDREETERLDAYTSSRLDVAYSRRGCLNTCYQRKLMQTCNVRTFFSWICNEINSFFSSVSTSFFQTLEKLSKTYLLSPMPVHIQMLNNGIVKRVLNKKGSMGLWNAIVQTPVERIGSINRFQCFSGPMHIREIW